MAKATTTKPMVMNQTIADRQSHPTCRSVWSAAMVAIVVLLAAVPDLDHR